MINLGSLITAGVALAVAIGGYLQFVLRRSVFPCIEFDVDLIPFTHSASDQSVGEVVLSMRNVGPGVGFVTSVQCRVKYRRAGEAGSGSNGVSPTFAHSLRTELQPPEGFNRILGQDAFALVSRFHRNFIQPGVTQWYRMPLAFPEDTQLVHVWAAFEYHIQVGRLGWFLASLLTERPDKRIVLYTVRRTFDVGGGRVIGAEDRQAG